MFDMSIANYFDYEPRAGPGYSDLGCKRAVPGLKISGPGRTWYKY